MILIKKIILPFIFYPVNICSKVYDPPERLLIKHKITGKTEILQRS